MFGPEEITYASRFVDLPVQLDRGRFWGLAFARSGERVAYVTHDLGFCQLLESDLHGRERRTILSLGEHEMISAVHGFGRDDRYVVFSANVRGRQEVRVVEVASRAAMTVARESFFGGWDDAHDAFFVWDRATGSRRVMRVNVSGKATLVDAGHMDRRLARSEDGRLLYYAEKFVADPADKRFTLYRADETGRTPFAMIATTCLTPRLKLALSPAGEYLYVSAFGPLHEGGDPVSFDLVVATDGSHRRLLAVKDWVSSDRALVSGRNRSLDVIDVRSGRRGTLVTGPVEQFAVTRDGTRIAFTSGGALHTVTVPA